MASLSIQGPELVVHLKPLEKLGALDGNLRIPLARVERAWVASEPWRELRGFRAPGTGIPRVIMLGTMRGWFGKDFCAVYGRGPAVIVELKGARFKRLVISVAQPEAIVQRIAELGAPASLAT